MRLNIFFMMTESNMVVVGSGGEPPPPAVSTISFSLPCQHFVPNRVWQALTAAFDNSDSF